MMMMTMTMGSHDKQFTFVWAAFINLSIVCVVCVHVRVRNWETNSLIAFQFTDELGGIV